MDNAWITHRLVAAGHAPGSEDFVCRADLQAREWLLTNGTGTYSMGTALGANTRRYHGLLVAATAPPVGRVLALNQVLDRLILGPDDQNPDAALQTIELASGLFRDPQGGWVHAPHGHESLAEFTRGLTVRWSYRWGNINLSRELILHDHEPAATLRYRVTGLKSLQTHAVLHVSPMLTLRDFHDLCHQEQADGSFDVQTAEDAARVTIRRGETAVTLASDDGPFVTDPDWWYAVSYPVDAHRGQGDAEDHFLPGRFEIPLKIKGKSDHVEVSLTVKLGDQPAAARTKPGRASRLKPMLKTVPADGTLQKALVIAADDFVVQRTVRGKALSTILAGYPWFADWGRDTFISLTGLLLATGRFNEARDVLKAFAGSIRDGLVPNRFDDYDRDAAHYNTVDASLWFVEAGLQYATETDNRPAWLIKALRQVLDAYAQGTHAQGHDGRDIPLGMADDGLIAAGDDHSQLTWMDAACGDRVFTPRPGKCVEINALWYTGLVGISQLLSTKDPEAAEHYQRLAKKAKRSFIRVFWSDDLKRLIDHVGPDGAIDWTLRPNMAFACSLHDSPLSSSLRKATLAAIKQSLLTPMGLRTLPCDDPAYHAHYGGPQFERDRAYHQGTVWPWLIGAYAEGVLRAGHFSAKAKTEARTAIDPLVNRLMGEGLGQLAEIHDSTEPHPARGCPAQAWSVAEVLRLLALIDSH